jgi:quercetin dioxygenase-like cupin family protein
MIGASMKPVKTFDVFGEPAEILVNGAMSKGTAAVLVQMNSPGSGPPPHRHTNEDETFTVLEGDFEFFSDGRWSRIPVGEVVFAPRGFVHTYRNAGTSTGRILVFVSPSGFEDYLEEVGSFSPATDMAKIIEISARYGISFHLD